MDRDRAPRHVLAPRQEWPWLPLHGHETLAQHPFCEECGLVKVLGSQAAVRFGGLMDLLARLERRMRHDGHRLTEAQRRLVVRRLEHGGADDRFGLSLTSQLSLLLDAVAATTGLHRAYLEGCLRSC